MRRIARQAALHRQERLAAQNDRVPEEQPVLLTEIPELGLVEPHGEGLAFRRRAVAFEANLRMIGDIPEPLHVTRIALVVRFLHAAARDDPFEQCALVDQKDVTESLDIGDAVGHPVDAIGSEDRLGLINVAAVTPERLRGAGVQKDAARQGLEGARHLFNRQAQGESEKANQLRCRPGNRRRANVIVGADVGKGFALLAALDRLTLLVIGEFEAVTVILGTEGAFMARLESTTFP
jgi:hypothetical protein